MDKEKFLPLEQAADLLGLKKSYLYKLGSQRHVLPYYKVGRKVLFLEADLLAYIRRGRVATNEELEAQAATERYLSKH